MPVGAIVEGDLERLHAGKNLLFLRLRLGRIQQVARYRAHQAAGGGAGVGLVFGDVILDLLNIAVEVVGGVLSRGGGKLQVAGETRIGHGVGAGAIALDEAGEEASGYEGVAQIVANNSGRPDAHARLADALAIAVAQPDGMLEDAVNGQENEGGNGRGEHQLDQRKGPVGPDRAMNQEFHGEA